MGPEWLTQTIQVLEAAGFRVEAGYPAHKAVHLTQTVAAVNLKGMDEKEVREILVTILTPRAMGLEQCQSRAAEGIQALAVDGNQWHFDRWRYEAGIDCWAIEISGTPAEVREEYTVSWGEAVQPYVTDFVARQEPNRRMIRPHGTAEPCGVIPGRQGWNLTLIQLLPGGEPEPENPEEPFTLTVSRGGGQTSYTGCRWSEYVSRQLPEGIQITRSAFALGREVNVDGQNAV